jgi:hypothetical protein
VGAPPPPGQFAGGFRYHSGICTASGNIVEIVLPSDQVPPISSPSNACTRR